MEFPVVLEVKKKMADSFPDYIFLESIYSNIPGPELYTGCGAVMPLCS